MKPWGWAPGSVSVPSSRPDDDPYATVWRCSGARGPSTDNALTTTGRQLAQLPSTAHRRMIASQREVASRVIVIARPVDPGSA